MIILKLLFIFQQASGLLTTFTTVAIGYYMAYRGEHQSIGLCFVPKSPGLRRACILDLTGGVMSILIGVLLLIIDFVSAYLNKNDVSLYWVILLLTFVVGCYV